MKIKKEIVVISIIFLLSFAFNLYFSMQIGHFSSDDAYFNLRHTEFISENMQPIVYDIQSYGGNYILDTHIWHYILAVVNNLFGFLVAFKIVPALLASLVVVFGYLIAREITKNDMASYFGALIFAFIPNFINLTLNQISIYSVFVPLMLLFIYSLLKIKERIGLFLITSFLITILDPMNFLFFLALIIFAILMAVDDIQMQNETKNGILFYVLLMILFNLILFKNIYLEQGLLAVWQNVPPQLYYDYFRSINIIGLIANIGIIPIILGVGGFVLGFLGEKKRDIYLLSSIIISCGILLLLKLISFDLGMMLLAVMLSITSVLTIDKFINYIKITKFARFKTLIIGAVMVIAIISLIIPATVYARDTIENGVSYEEIEALEWIRDNTPTGSSVVGNVYEGNLISSIAQRINVIDTQFILAENRYVDISNLFQTESLVKAQRTLAKYNADYIYFSDKTKHLYGIDRLKYVNEEICFDEVFSNEEATVYEVVC
ncbi:MAG: hypothetical protein ABIJ18_00050 [archaeon]